MRIPAEVYSLLNTDWTYRFDDEESTELRGAQRERPRLEADPLTFGKDTSQNLRKRVV